MSEPKSMSVSKDPRGRLLTIHVLCTTLATGLLVLSAWVPFWQMTLRAPQYPAGLRLVAYGTEVLGDLREINIINHYVGMEHIDTVPAPEMSLFPFLLAGLIALAWLGLLHRWLARLAVVATVLAPLVILADLQWWLHSFGRNLDPTAPIRVEPFTPLAIGTSKVGNFDTIAWGSWGFFAMLGAAFLLLYGARRRYRAEAVVARHVTTRAAGAPAAVALVAVFVVGPHVARAQTSTAGGHTETASLQAMIDSAAPGSTVRVPAGTYTGPIEIRGPLHVIGDGAVEVVGTGVGSVVRISGDGVLFEGFGVRRSGRAVTEEAAGIKATGSRHVIRGNRIEDVYFGIHLSDGGDNTIEDNVVAPGERYGARPGHAISLWNQSGARVVGNDITDARDGIYLSFADRVDARDNAVTGCRYGIHSMYSEDSNFVGNRLEGNLLGAALMYSDGLRMSCNRLVRNRSGATAYGILLKDINDLVVERNVIVANRVGIYADNTPLGRGHRALVRDNVIAGNDAALALQSNVALTFFGNRVSGNLVDVRSEGGSLASSSSWSEAGRGNYWDGYNGYDADGDGVGDVPYRYEVVMNELVARNPLVRAFVYSPASLALERAARLFPVYRPEPLLVDAFPLMREEPVACEEGR